MITLFSGTPGSGKSLHLASVIYWHLRRKKPVISNVDINLKYIKNPDYFIYIPNEKISAEIITEYCQKYLKTVKKSKEGDILLVLDEAQLLFNARSWQVNDAKGWISFFTQHRKYRIDIYLIAQFDRMLDRQIRSLIEYEEKHRKITNFGAIGKIIKILCIGDIFLSVRVWYPLKERIGVDFFRAKKLYYRLYDTYQIWSKSDAQPKPLL